jgi:GT2 family glycosyltransferase
MSTVGLVVIGRNEGNRLIECLKSSDLQKMANVVYVDSGSSDASVESARNLGFDILELDGGRRFSASRARNEGVKFLTSQTTDLEFIQFLDGDCILAPTWLESGVRFLKETSDCSAVIGHLQERHPHRSIYNLLCALEWRSPAGEINDFGSFGGISLIRLSMFNRLEGFNENIIAGEDSEFAVRMALAGARVFKLDHDMATHDAAITRFAQWWQRAVRSGHAIAQRVSINGDSKLKDCIRARTSVAVWGVVMPLMAFLLISFFGWGGALVPICAYAYLGSRIFRFRRGRGDSTKESLIYSFFTVLAKFAQVIGIARYHRNSFLKRFEIIEYK